MKAAKFILITAGISLGATMGWGQDDGESPVNILGINAAQTDSGEVAPTPPGGLPASPNDSVSEPSTSDSPWDRLPDDVKADLQRTVPSNFFKAIAMVFRFISAGASIKDGDPAARARYYFNRLDEVLATQLECGHGLTNWQIGTGIS